MNGDWLSAAETMRKVEGGMSRYLAGIMIASRAYDGLLRTRAERFVKHRQVLDDVELPTQFWWATGHQALTQNWTTGDFATWIDSREHWKAYGVTFFRPHVEKIAPPPPPVATVPPVAPSSEPDDRSLGSVSTDVPPRRAGEKGSGGRRLSALWPDWVAELAMYIHDEGVPAGEGSQGQEDMIKTIADRLVERGKDAPSRTTVQPAVQAVLDRLRSAGN